MRYLIGVSVLSLALVAGAAAHAEDWFRLNLSSPIFFTGDGESDGNPKGSAPPSEGGGVIVGTPEIIVRGGIFRAFAPISIPVLVDNGSGGYVLEDDHPDLEVVPTGIDGEFTLEGVLMSSTTVRLQVGPEARERPTPAPTRTAPRVPQVQAMALEREAGAAMAARMDKRVPPAIRAIPVPMAVQVLVLPAVLPGSRSQVPQPEAPSWEPGSEPNRPASKSRLHALGSSDVAAAPWTLQPRLRLVSHKVVDIPAADQIRASPVHVMWSTSGFMRLLGDAALFGKVPAIVHTQSGERA